jgi:uncharacterized protein (UPF0210 family)
MIRSLTIGLPLDHASTAEIEEGARRVLDEAGKVLSKAQLSPRTKRFTLPPSGADAEIEGALLSRIRWVDDLARRTQVRWFCLPLDFMDNGPRRVRTTAALDAVVRFERLFLNMILAHDRRMAVNAAHDAAKLVLDVSRKSNNGFDNFRVGVSFNCPANAPFFPFSQHAGSKVAFSFALETTPLALEIARTGSLPADTLRDKLVERLVPYLRQVEEIGQQIAHATQTEYRGVDASLAPMPSDNVSVAALIELLTGAPVGSHSSVFATALLTDALRTALAASHATAVGFNGVMYSVLEDPALASANSKRLISLDTLVALSTVCACGLDMVPIPGLSFPEEVSAVMLDVAAVSCALDKPLGVRLLPIPNGQVNEFTKLNLDFLCDSRVIGLTANDRRLQTQEHVVGFRTPRH